MRWGRFFALETGLALAVTLSPLFFGSVYLWTAMSFCGFLFLLLFFYPEAVLEVRNLPRTFKFGILSVFLVVILQFSLSLNPHATASELLKWLAFASAFLLVRLLPPSSLSRLMAVIIFLGVCESLYGLIELWSGHEKVLWRAKTAHLGFVTGTYFNRNHLAGLLELCLGVQLGFLLRAIRQKSFKAVPLLTVTLLITLIGFLGTGSRMGITSFIVSFGIFTYALLRKTRKMAYSFLFVTALLGVTGFIASRGVLFLRLEDLVGDSGNWEGGRLEVWKNSLAIVRDYPWLGTGLGSFKWVFPSYQSEDLLMRWDHAHNDYLELAVELGIPGLVLLLVSFASQGLLIAARQFSVSGSSSEILWGVLVSLTSFSLHALTDFNFAIPANCLVFILLFSISFLLSRPSNEERPRV